MVKKAELAGKFRCHLLSLHIALEEGIAGFCALVNITTETDSLRLPPAVLLEPFNNSPYNGTVRLPLPSKTHATRLPKETGN